jgi:RNA recognition motif-containing protein
MNIYVGNLERAVTDDELKAIFTEFGEITSASVIRDKYTGESRGFGFVEMPAKAEAIEAIKQVDGKEINGKRLIVNEARQKQDRRPGGNRGGGGRGRGGSRGGGRGGRY